MPARSRRRRMAAVSRLDRAPTGRRRIVYQRWQTTPYVAVRDRTSLFRAVTTEGALIPVAQREQQFDAGVYRAMRRVRWTQTLTGAYHAERVSTAAPSLDQRVDRSGLRTAWTLVHGTHVRILGQP